MSSRKIILIAFVLVALAQLFVPAKMILDRENILQTGNEYKFKTAPIDPNDPFRGKYIFLRYDEDSIKVDNIKEWKTGEAVYVSLATNSQGFAQILSVSKEKPTDNQDFLSVKVGYIPDNLSNTIAIDYPFDRFYLEESKAYNAEKKYIEMQHDTTKVTYALVNIKNGEAVLKDVMVNGVSISKLVDQEQKQ